MCKLVRRSTKLTIYREGVAELKEDRSSARELIITASQEVGQLRGAVKEVCTLLDSVIWDTRKLLPQDKVGTCHYLSM